MPAFLARDPGPDSGAMMLEYTAHDAAAEIRSLVLPVAAQSVSVARGVESHASLAPIAVRRASEALAALRVLVATELVVAVRALRLTDRGPGWRGHPRAVRARRRGARRGTRRPAAASGRRRGAGADRALAVGRGVGSRRVRVAQHAPRHHARRLARSSPGTGRAWSRAARRWR